MKRTWLIGAALMISLSAVGCADDSEEDDITLPDGALPDSGTAGDSGVVPGTDSGVDAGGMDASTDAGSDGGEIDATTPPADAATDAAADDAGEAVDASGLDAA